MKRLFAAGLLLAAVAAAPAWAADKPAKADQHTKYDLYVTAAEAHAMMTAGGKRVVLVDVRDPIELMFTGSTPMAEVFVPWQIADASALNEKKPVYAMTKNPNFLPQLEERLAKIGATKDTALVIMCRSGSSRSAPVANLLHEAGYKEVYSMVDGFEGEPAKDGASKGVRTVGGWRNSGLPWGYDIDKDKAWLAQ